MKKEDITLIAQLLTGMKDAMAKLEQSQKKKDWEEAMAAKREILSFQKQIGELL